jgi:hypothetical protein
MARVGRVPGVSGWGWVALPGVVAAAVLALRNAVGRDRASAAPSAVAGFDQVGPGEEPSATRSRRWRRFDDAFIAAIRSGDGPAFERYLEYGPEVVDHQYALKAGLHHTEPIRSSKSIVENARFLLDDVAARYPQQFLAAFADQRWDEDADAVGALGYTGDPVVVPRLVRILGSGSSETRVASAIALRMVDDPRRVAALRAALDGTERSVAYHVLASLAEIGGPDDIPALAAIRAHDDRGLSREAGEAIAAIERRHGAPA